MFKGFSVLSFAILLTISTSFAQATTQLTQLPFGIRLGTTTNKEIENRGRCIKQIQVTHNYFRCEEYDMLNGKFIVKSSQNEIVSGIFFDAQKGHALPQSWQNAGIKLSPIYKYLESNGGGKGNSREEFLEIITADAENISTKIIDTRDNSGGFGNVARIVSFNIGNSHFDAVFSTETSYDSYIREKVTHERGLVSLEITEAY